MTDDLNYDLDNFADIIAEDDRFHPRAYTLLMAVIHSAASDGKHITGHDLLEEFRDFTLDKFGPMAYTVLTNWGINNCTDIGEMVFNLVESKRISKSANDSMADFIGGYSFEEAFLAPYNP